MEQGRSSGASLHDCFRWGIFLCAAAGVDAGCSDVPKLQFANYCEKDVRLEDWDMVIPAGQMVDIVQGRQASQRIRWKYADYSTEMWDFIELNVDWAGPGTCYRGHPSYSSYNGYNMASKYEALNPDTGEPACPDMGAEVSYTPEDCPSGPGHGYLCQGNSDCASEYSRYIKSCSNAINPDGSRTPTFKDTTYGANYVNFWCNEIHGFHEIVGTLMHCVEHSVPFVLRITTCNVNGPPPAPPTTTPEPTPPPTTPPTTTLPTTPPSTTPPSTTPPSTMPPSTTPPSTMPPSTTPPSTTAPQTTPPSTMPTSASSTTIAATTTSTEVPSTGPVADVTTTAAITTTTTTSPGSVGTDWLLVGGGIAAGIIFFALLAFVGGAAYRARRQRTLPIARINEDGGDVALVQSAPSSYA